MDDLELVLVIREKDTQKPLRTVVLAVGDEAGLGAYVDDLVAQSEEPYTEPEYS